MTRPDHEEAARALASAQHGLVTRTALRDLGVSRSAIRNLVATRRWEQLTDEVLRLVGTPDSTQQRLLAAVLDSGPGAALSHLAGARHWGLEGCPIDPICVTRMSSSQRRSSLAVVHQVRSLPAAWVTELDGIPIVRPELLALQLFAVCSEPRAERLVERLWSDRLLSGASLRAFLDALGRRGRNGTAGLRRYLDVRGPAYVPTASGVESRAQQVLRAAGIEVRRQVNVGDEHSWTGRVDFVVVEHPVVIEVQSERHHSALVDTTADAARLAALRASGWIVVEVTDVVVWTQPQVLVDRVRHAVMAQTTARLRGGIPFCPAE